MTTLNLATLCESLQENSCCDITDNLYKRILLMLTCSINSTVAELSGGDVTAKAETICEEAPNNCCDLPDPLFHSSLLTLLCNINTNLPDVLATVAPAVTAQAGIIALGTDLATATALTAYNNIISTVAVAGRGVKLPNVPVGSVVHVLTQTTANAAELYPTTALQTLTPDSGVAGALGAPILLATAGATIAIKTSATAWSVYSY